MAQPITCPDCRLSGYITRLVQCSCGCGASGGDRGNVTERVRCDHKAYAEREARKLRALASPRPDRVEA